MLKECYLNDRIVATVHGYDKSTVKSPVKPASPGGTTRRVLPVHNESDRGRVVGGIVRNEVTDSLRSCTFPSAVRRVRRTRVQPTARDELAVVASISANPREHLRIFLWFVYAAITALTGSCAGRQSLIKEVPKDPPIGLYQVIERTCQYLPGTSEECHRIQYVELVRGTFYGIGEKEIALVFWIQGGDPTYVAFKLRGHFIDDHTYLIDEVPSSKKEWFVIYEGSISEYSFIKTRNTSNNSEVDKTHLRLKRVSRTPELNRLLAYPTDD
jgi:hypothetical protein